jgi:uncharacterized damage-inducible protein DinB
MSAQLAKKYDEIEEIKNDFLSKIENVSHQKLNEIPADGKWSLGQVYFHLYYAESGTIKVIQKNLRENKIKNKSGISDSLRSVLLKAVMRSPLKIKAPAVASKVPDSITIDEIKGFFTANTEIYRQLLTDLPIELEDKQIFKHPLAGLFNIEQTINFVREHYLHHERQVNALLK